MVFYWFSSFDSPGDCQHHTPLTGSQVTWRPAVSVTARSTKVSSRRRFSSILCLVAFCVRSILRCLVTSGESSLQCHNMSTVSRAVCSVIRCLLWHMMSAVTWDVCSDMKCLQCLSSSPALSVWRDSEALRWLIDLEYFRSYQTTICYEFLSDKNCYWPSGWVFTAPRVLQPATRN